MKLRDLEPQFVRREVRAVPPDEFVDGVRHTTGQAEYRVHVDTAGEADGIYFLCPTCFVANGGPVGTHSVCCWRQRVPSEVPPGPGRWEFQGSGYDDLSLVAPSSSILLTSGCNAHFFVQNGEVRPA